jgi:Peptidase family M28
MTQPASLWWRLSRIVLIAAALCSLLAIYVTQPLLPFGTMPTNASPAVDTVKLEQHVHMLSQTLAPRDQSHLENLDAAADYIRTELTRRGGRVSEQPYKVKERLFRNVIASFGPEAGERIVIGAHYDACDPLPGADDNASGVAGLIELAGLLSAHPPALCVDLVAYTLEEPPYFATTAMGSYMHAEQLRKSGVEVRLMMSLEMIGYFTDAPHSQKYPAAAMALFYPDTGNFITVGGRFGEASLTRRIKAIMKSASDLPVYSFTAPDGAYGIDFSDNRNYWYFEYPAVIVSDTAFFRNRNYHTAADTADTLDYARMAKVVQGVYAVVADAEKL